MNPSEEPAVTSLFQGFWRLLRGDFFAVYGQLDTTCLLGTKVLAFGPSKTMVWCVYGQNRWPPRARSD